MYFIARRSERMEDVPRHKRVSGTDFLVDAFTYQSKRPTRYWFLTHFHSDHYMGLSSKFDCGSIFATKTTYQLCVHMLKVPTHKFVIIPFNSPTAIPGTTAKVVALDANHCPGAAMFVFILEDGTTHLHSGDLRYTPDMNRFLTYKISNLYLDTTYCDPKYVFPTQTKAISEVVKVVKSHWEDQGALFLIGTYTIGKERVAVDLANRFKCKIGVTGSKMKILEQTALDHSLFSIDTDCRIRLVSMQTLGWKSLDDLETTILRTEDSVYTRIIAFRPTGWAFSKGSSITTKGNVQVHSVPYSEHSSFSELKAFVKAVKPKKLIPTVNCSTQKLVKNDMCYVDLLSFRLTNKCRSLMISLTSQLTPPSCSCTLIRNRLVLPRPMKIFHWTMRRTRRPR